MPKTHEVPTLLDGSSSDADADIGAGCECPKAFLEFVKRLWFVRRDLRGREGVRSVGKGELRGCWSRGELLLQPGGGECVVIGSVELAALVRR